jgi:KilA-N domain
MPAPSHLEGLEPSKKVDKKPARADLHGLETSMIKVDSIGNKKMKYEISGTYVHQDLIPNIASWIREHC